MARTAGGGDKLRSTEGDKLPVHPHCLMFFVDETGREMFADPRYPVFGMGGCAILVAAIDSVPRAPWRELKARHFGGADVALHASDLREPTRMQIEAPNTFSLNQQIGRFAVPMSAALAGVEPIQVMPGLRRRQMNPVLIEK